MTEQSRLSVLLVCLAGLAGMLSWGVLGGTDGRAASANRCVWAITNNDGAGYQEAPCRQSTKDLFEHRDEGLYCDAALQIPAPNGDLGRCPRPRRAVTRSEHGPVHGTVVRWNDEEGWGVLASPSVRGEVWAHFSMIAMDGHRSLVAGQPVVFTYETPGQDGYPHRAVSVRPQ